MISMEQISGEIAALEEEKPTHVIMQKLAALYTVRDRMIINSNKEATTVVVSDTIPEMDSESDFMKLIYGKSIKDVLPIVDELVQTISVLNPGLYKSVLRKING